LLEREGCFLHITDSSIGILSGSYSRSTKISPIDDSDYHIDLEVFLKPQESEDNAKLEDFVRTLRRFYSRKSKKSQDDINFDLQE
jgi:hypothetical protein